MTQDGTIRPEGMGFQEANRELKDRILAAWSWVKPRWLHADDGFTVVAVEHDEIVGFISVQWRQLPPPLAGVEEGFVDIIDVSASHRRRGIGRRLVELAIARCRARGVYQVRAWSSQDKVEAIPMWRALGFGLCPATEHPRGQAVRGYFVAFPLA